MKESPTRSSSSIGSLRFLAWVAPSLILPLFVMIVVVFPLLGALVLIPAILGFIYLAKLDAKLRCQQRKIPEEESHEEVRRGVTRFVVLQVVIVPILWFSISTAFCAISGFSIR